MSQSSAPVKRRARGEVTRNLILEATLSLIAKQGIRAVTHRAVAAEAEVQLSLTTYYFKDINELIAKAFTHYCERGRPELNDVWVRVDEVLNRHKARELRSKQLRIQVCNELVELGKEYILGQIRENADSLCVEQIFFADTSLSDNLRELVNEHRAHLFAPMEAMCAKFNRHDPHIDATILLDTILSFEYASVGRPMDDARQAELDALLKRLFGWILGIHQYR
ncbi:TetR/AcrR family transcriptional regulator [Paraferrimonas sedimenticola]|uniref:TetR family transcriptional regulator n=1 Tax=Paraferrimonas sedimenticola TaxID=375674 RepID=A0AA37RZZ6_9GAMM|nr:TetR family transcriptional regulator [Paraferrimonas sedimenticola]GLP97777.1 TetR family transcriptional regulator [Paraferrimonas sedimenticola]